MIMTVDPAQAELDLVAGLLPCPDCQGVLRPWGHARARRVRDLGVRTLTARPRRARCADCGATQVLIPGALAPRRADSTAVIGTALLASAAGTGYRRIAADLDRPTSTVRRWIRSVTPAHAEQLRGRAMGWLARLDPEAIATLAPARTRLGDALNALAAAALAARARFAPHASLWALLARFAGGELLPTARPG